MTFNCAVVSGHPWSLTCVRDVCRSHDPPDLLHALQVWTQSPVTTEDLLVNNRGDGETVETVGECLPQLDIVPSFA